ncbi:MAG: hypothetical protein IPN48_05095 [Sphingomonadales bacterium]|nr:hypothetical protein [Sphingomonadales bacterium]
MKTQGRRASPRMALVLDRLHEAIKIPDRRIRILFGLPKTVLMDRHH